MRYNINARLVYDAADGTLTLSDSQAPDTQLSITASALLLFFLQHQQVISRDEVLKKVWDEHGLTSSNSNLNQYLSMLRKTFRHYGINNIILTISRGHLQLNPDLTVVRVDPPSSQRPPEAESLLPQEAPPLAAPLRARPDRRASGIRWYLASAMLLLLSLLATVLSRVNHFSSPAVSPAIAAGQKCELMATADMIGSVAAQAYQKNFAAVIARLGLTCKPGQRFIFSYGDKLQTKGLGRVFLAHCELHGDIPYGYCDNYFYYSWEP